MVLIKEPRLLGGKQAKKWYRNNSIDTSIVARVGSGCRRFRSNSSLDELYTLPEIKLTFRNMKEQPNERFLLGILTPCQTKSKYERYWGV